MSNTEPRVEVRPDRRSVLPWRRHHVDVEVAPLIAAYRERHRKADTALIEQAFEVARDAHADQVRRSGEPYIAHPLGVAMILADLGLDDVTIAAALLHDAVEDTTVTDRGPRRASSGRDVAAIVDGVTKLDRLQFDSKEAQQAATLRKMLVAMAKDIRVLLIKLADRLHNMRTIASLPEAKQQRIAQETLDIYAPLAHRLGIADVKWQLEDLAFAVLHPKRYAEIEQMVTLPRARARAVPRAGARPSCAPASTELHIEAEVTRPAEALLVDLREDGRAGQGVRRRPGPRRRARHRRVGQGLLRRARVDPRDVAAGAGPLQGLHRDAEVQPLPVAAHDGRRAAGQARRGADPHARRCTAAPSTASPRTGATRSRTRPPRTWCGSQRMVDWQQETSDPGEFMETLKIDLEQDEVFVFTPKGKVITLPTGATPVDFAYAIHTEVGHRCIGARVNGRLVPLDSTLASGDTVEIFTSKVEGAGPSRDWLQFVQTPRARSKIRQWFSRERREDAIETGRDELVKALRKDGLPVQKLARSSALAHVVEAMQLRRPRRAVRRDRRRATSRRGRSCSASSASCAAARSSCRSPSRRPPRTLRRRTVGRARRGSRRRHGAAVALLHARCPATRSWAS